MAEHEKDKDLTVDRTLKASVRALWQKSWLTGLTILAFSYFYFFIRQYFKDGIWRADLNLANKAVAVTSLFLISLSMLQTGLSLIRKSRAKNLAIRKYFGLVGFWFGLTHAVFSHLIFPVIGLKTEGAPWGEELSEFLARLALFLFFIMALLSNNRIKARIKGKKWLSAMRYLGYSGLIFAAIHASLLKWPSWVRYFSGFKSILPSLSLPVVIIAVVTLILRIYGSVLMAKRYPSD